MEAIYYYVSGHTAKGKVNYIESNIRDIDDLVVLQHPSNKLKTAILQAALQRYEQEQVELILHPLRKDYLAGFICRSQSRAMIIDELEIKQGRKVDLTAYLPVDTLQVESYENEIESTLHRAYQVFAAGLNIHDDLESIYLQEMDFHKADRLAYDVIGELFHHVEKKDKQAKLVKRLFGTNTADGMTNQLAALTEQVKKRYFIKGRAGTGKSHLMKQVLKECEKYGLDMEIYHCSFDPESIDMLIIRELDTCLFDSTAPHALEPSRMTDNLIDMYGATVKQGTDEKYAREIHQVSQQYKAKMKKGLAILSEIISIDDRKEALFSDKEIQRIISKDELIVKK